LKRSFDQNGRTLFKVLGDYFRFAIPKRNVHELNCVDPFPISPQTPLIDSDPQVCYGIPSARRAEVNIPRQSPHNYHFVKTTHYQSSVKKQLPHYLRE
jgi:hypothetical protein